MQPANIHRGVARAGALNALLRQSGLTVLLGLSLCACTPSPGAVTSTNSSADASAASAKSSPESLKAEEAAARARVVAIVNQPITHLPRTDEAATFSPGWFHAGADAPDFAGADVRTTQELPYAKFEYVTSDLNPSEMFVGGQLEFNSNTKYFYTDRSLPKARLSQAEMVEINGLYRTIARDERALGAP